jgi:plasmid stabilization system protein ParE
VTGYRLTPRAREGLRDILAHVEERFGPRTALRVIERIDAALTRLSEAPGLGRPREEFTRDPQVRFWPVGPTLIAYRAVGSGIEVLLLERGERNWFELLRELQE